MQKDLSKLEIPADIFKNLEQKYPVMVTLNPPKFWLPLIETLLARIEQLKKVILDERREKRKLEEVELQYLKMNKLSELQQAIKLLEKNGFNVELRFKK